MLLQPTQPSESILGYTLTKKIGAGGYGEVWAAEAPGGLTKAVKLIFGFHDETRAQRELKALNRIKEVRHPFLLSLERIDVVDGRLVVVTELAERSLKDRFRECIENGDLGIPREELLSYLADAAEALDFIFESHSLLHLDVKPENLLLVGGHVKLADFGLVKDSQESFQSMMGGLTPTYAAPEIFDGQPGRASDQYSLAIVMQEMLTGKRPFQGGTPAKLALQHLHETPDLTMLTPGDQAPLQRALAKSPEARFPSCRAFVEEIARCRSRPRRRRPETRLTNANDTPSHDASDHTVATPMGGINAIAKRQRVEQLPPMEFASEEAKFQPTLFIGIGQTATTVLRQLKRRLQERLGDKDERAALGILCLDTDTRDLDEATRGDGLDVLDQDEVVPLPLKGPAEYRENADFRFSWLSRRWIYNIPRSGQTECLRPLGRLAFVDHINTVFDRLHQAIECITESDVVKRTANQCQMTAGDVDPRVFVVASITGGTGSGMVADVAYAVRMALAERGLQDFPVNGVLLTSTGGPASRRDITIANAYCCLNEIHHYSQVHGYPGDPSCDLPAFEDVPTFDTAYMVDMGSDPLADEYIAMADMLAEYLYLDAATPCGPYLDACRDDDLLIDEGMYVRTLGVSHSGGVDSDAVSVASHAVCHHLLKSWLQTVRQVTETRDTPTPDINLEVDHIVHLIRDRLSQRLERDPLDRVQKELESFCTPGNFHENRGPEYRPLMDMEDQLDKLFGIRHGRAVSSLNASIKPTADLVTDGLADELFEQIEAHIMSRLDETGCRVGRTESSQKEFEQRIDGMGDRVAAKQRVLRDQLPAVNTVLDGSDSDDDSNNTSNDARMSFVEAVRQYGRIRLEDFLSMCAKRLVDRLRQQVGQITYVLSDMRKQVASLADDFEQKHSRPERHAMPGVTATNALVSALIFESTTSEIHDLVAQLDEMVQQKFIVPQGRFQRLGDQNIEAWRDELTRAMYRLSRSLVAARIEVMDFDVMLRRHGVTEDRLASWVDESLGLSTPNLFESCGGMSRLLVAMPRGSKGEMLQNVFKNRESERPRMLAVTDGDIVFCHDVGGIPLQQVAARLLQSCPRCTELVSRVHTRSDVQWAPLIRLE